MRHSGQDADAARHGGAARQSGVLISSASAVLILTIIGTLNLLRSPTGRAFIAIRDSETAARSMGVNVALYKVKSFAISAAITGFCRRPVRAQAQLHLDRNVHAAALDQFIIVILIVAPSASHGGRAGRDLPRHDRPVPDLPQDDMPHHRRQRLCVRRHKATASNIQAMSHLLPRPTASRARSRFIIMVFVLFEPLGLYGRWLKIKLFFQLFPLYKRATFKRQKIYVKSERNR